MNYILYLFYAGKKNKKKVFFLTNLMQNVPRYFPVDENKNEIIFSVIQVVLKIV